MKYLCFVFIMSMLLIIACGGADSQKEPLAEGDMPDEQVTPLSTPIATETVPEAGTPSVAPMVLTSSAFSEGEEMPARYTCFGENLSVPLEWTDPPATTKSFVLICDDPDAPRGDWVHWALYNIPARTRALSEAADQNGQLPAGTVTGENSWGRSDYGGPCPPSGTHRYFFGLYALDTGLDLEAGADIENLLLAMKGHILEQAELMGLSTKH